MRMSLIRLSLLSVLLWVCGCLKAPYHPPVEGPELDPIAYDSGPESTPEDACPDGDRNGSEPGCGDMRVEIQEEQIRIVDAVYFSAGDAAVPAPSEALLDEIAMLLRDNPGLRLGIDGHAGSGASADETARLSQARADAVRAALIARGVPADALESMSYGDSRPIEPGASPRNDRVSFQVLEPTLRASCPSWRPNPAVLVGEDGCPVRPEGAGHELVRVWFATDRAWKDGTFVPARTSRTKKVVEEGLDKTVPAPSFGQAMVTIPPGHARGAVERPLRILSLELAEDKERHVTMRVQPLDPATFFGAVGRRAAASDRKQAFVFIHGFNVGIDDALYRTGQVAYDLGFDGAPILYSWPSKGSFAGYLADEANERWSGGNLARFLTELRERTGVERVHLIAHSMGNRVLANALAALPLDGQSPRFDEVVFAAPDLDPDFFESEIAPRLPSLARRATLYVSSTDHALEVSATLHAIDRLGEAEHATDRGYDNVETIDVTEVDDSALGHSYYGSSSPVLADLRALLRGMAASTTERALSVVRAGRVWRLRSTLRQPTPAP